MRPGRSMAVPSVKPEDTEMSSLCVIDGCGAGADRSILSEAFQGMDVPEVFSPRGGVRATYALEGGSSMDPTTGWNFDRAEDRDNAEAQVRKENTSSVSMSSAIRILQYTYAAEHCAIRLGPPIGWRGVMGN